MMGMEDNNELTPEDWLTEGEGCTTIDPLSHSDPVFEAGVREAFDRLEREHVVVTTLRQLRQAIGLSQTDVAVRWGHGQSHVSQIEREPSRAELTTLAGYVRALGGRLTVTIEAGDNVYIEDLVDSPAAHVVIAAGQP